MFESHLIRSYLAGDEAAMSAVCVRTADAGRDASGMLSNDQLWSDLYLLPYLAHDPDLALVVVMDGELVGYLVATPDADAFSTWFATHWWPTRGWGGESTATDTERRLLRLAESTGRAPWPAATSPDLRVTAPAELHLNLLPRAQGKGVGRALIQRLAHQLTERSIPGVRATVDRRNSGALAFYPKVGFVEDARDSGSVTFARDLQVQDPRDHNLRGEGVRVQQRLAPDDLAQLAAPVLRDAASNGVFARISTRPEANGDRLWVEWEPGRGSGSVETYRLADLSAAEAALWIAETVQEVTMERDQSHPRVWPLCAEHNLGLHPRESRGAILWSCSRGHDVAAVGELTPPLHRPR